MRARGYSARDNRFIDLAIGNRGGATQDKLGSSSPEQRQNFLKRNFVYNLWVHEQCLGASRKGWQEKGGLEGGGTSVAGERDQEGLVSWTTGGGYTRTDP